MFWKKRFKRIIDSINTNLEIMKSLRKAIGALNDKIVILTDANDYLLKHSDKGDSGVKKFAVNVRDAVNARITKFMSNQQEFNSKQIDTISRLVTRVEEIEDKLNAIIEHHPNKEIVKAEIKK